VTTIILNKPEVKNAIDFYTAELLAKTVLEFEQDDNARVGVLYGVGGFSAGADLKAIGGGKFNRLEDDGNGPLGCSRFELSKPMIAAVSGD
jgi:enoyl-CoA hydratase